MARRRGLFTDHQGSIIAVTSASGSAFAINGYDAWGIRNPENDGAWVSITGFDIRAADAGPPHPLGDESLATSDIRSGEVTIWRRGAALGQNQSRSTVVHEVTHFKEPYRGTAKRMSREEYKGEAGKALERDVKFGEVTMRGRLTLDGEPLVQMPRYPW